MAQGGQLAAQGVGVVQLPVVADGTGAPLPGAGHGLLALSGVDDR